MSYSKDFDPGEIGALFSAYDRIFAPAVAPDQLAASAPILVSRADIAGAAVFAGAANTALKLVAEGKPTADLVALRLSALTIETGPPPPIVTGPARVAWLAQNFAIRGLFRRARPYDGPEVTIPPTPSGAVQVPIVIAITVLGAAAIGGASWFAVESHKATMELEGQTRALAQQAHMYAQQVAAAQSAGQPIPPPPDVVQRMADAEESSWKWGAGALVGVGMAVLVGYYLRPTVAVRSNPTPPRRPPAKRAPAKRATAKRAPAKRAAKKTTAKRAAKKTTAKRAPAKRAAKKTTAKRAAKKTTAKRAAKKTTAKRAPAKRAAKKTTAKRAPAKRAAKKTTAKRAPAKRAPSSRQRGWGG